MCDILCNILVVFNDDNKKVFNDVKQFGFNREGSCYFIEKEELRCFIQPENVKYIGPVEFWEDKEETKIIRCKDCKYFGEDPYYFRGRTCCKRLDTGFLDNPMPVNPYDFCSRAVSKNE